MSQSSNFLPPPKQLEEEVEELESPGHSTSHLDQVGAFRRVGHDSDAHRDPPPSKSIKDSTPQQLDTAERIHADESQDKMLADEGGSASAGALTFWELISQKRTDSLKHDLDNSSDSDTTSFSISTDLGRGSNSSDVDPFLHPNSPLDAKSAQSLSTLAQQFGDVVDITKGKEVVISHPGSSQYTQGNVSACGLAALNCVRAILRKERDEKLSGTALLQHMMRPETIGEIVAICQKWESQGHLDVEGIYQIPLFEESLKLHSTHSGRPSAEEFRKLLSDMQDFENSATLVIARPPNIIACFKISVPMCDVFVTFDCNPRPSHAQGPSFAFSISLYETAQRIETILDIDDSASADPGPAWQARLSDSFSSHLFTANEGFKITSIEAASTRILEMDISALQLKTESLDLKAQMDQLNQTKLHLEGSVETTDRLLGELRSELERVKTESDRHNETMRRGWLERDEKVESQHAIIVSLQAEVEKLQRGVVDKVREHDSANAALTEEVSRLKEQLKQRDILAANLPDPPRVPVSDPLPDSSQSTTVNGSPTLTAMSDVAPNDNKPSKDTQTPGGEPGAYKPLEGFPGDGVRIAPPAKRLPRVDIEGKGKGKGKGKERVNGPFWRILPPPEVPGPPDFAKSTGAQRPSSSSDSDDNPWRLSSSQAGPSGIRNREQRPRSSKAIAVSSQADPSAIKAAPTTGAQNVWDQAAANYQRRVRPDAKQDPGPSLSSNERKFRVGEYDNPISARGTPATANLVPNRIYPDNARADLDADRVLAERLQYDWNVGDSETAREIERALREENKSQIGRPKQNRAAPNKSPGWSNSKIAQDPARPAARTKQKGYDWMEALARDQAVQENTKLSAPQARAKDKHQSTLDYEVRFATMPVNDAAWRQASPPPPKAVKTMLHDILRAREEENAFHKALRIQQQYEEEEELKRLQNQLIAEDIFLEEELAAMQQPSFECGVCLETMPMSDVARVDECDHELCRQCMKGYVSSKVQERRYPIPCPLCQVSDDGREAGVIGISTIETLGISEDDFLIYEELQMTQFAIPVECKGCQRTVFIDREEHQASKELTCPLPGCQYKWCKACQQPIDPQLTVEHSCDGSKELDALILGQNWKKCPQCATPIEKISGCNHMSCISPGCNTHFCYVCGIAFYRGPWCDAAARAKSAHLGGACGVGG